MATLRLGAFTKSLRGKAGNTVFAETALGCVARDVSIPTGAATPAQIAARTNMKKDGAAWQSLSAENVANWRAYASRIVRKGKKSSKPYVPNAYQEFTALTTKWYQIHGAGAAPVAPPTGEFAGDVIEVQAEAGVGGIQFTGGGANAAGVMTELLLQPIKGKHRKAGAEGYVSKAFVAFSVASPRVTVPVGAGYYAAAYRFVEAATGRQMGIVPIATLTVSLSVESGGTGEAPVTARAKKAA